MNPAVNPAALALLIFACMLLLMALRVPIAVTMFTAGALGYGLQAGFDALAHFLNHQAFARFANYDLSVIPLFLLMGHLATQGGISRALFAAASRLLGRMRGGLGMASVLAAAAFGSICGSSVATAATITSVALPEMRRHGYPADQSTATLAAGGTLGILIPPSVPLVIYAILAEQNIAKLFAAALVPGVLAMLGYMAVVWLTAPRAAAPKFAESTASPESAQAAPNANPTPNAPPRTHGVAAVAVVFAVVFGGIYAGFFTPTEGAAVGVAATAVAALWMGELNAAALLRCCLATAQGTAMIFLIFIGADVMNAALALTQVPMQLAAWVQGLPIAPLLVVVLILLFYIVLGSVMDELSMLLLTIPILFPVVMGLDFGMPKESVAIWFGILVLMTVGFGMLAPPVGLNVYVVSSMAKDVPIAHIYRRVLPFLASDALRMLLVLLCPSVALWVVGFVR